MLRFFANADYDFIGLRRRAYIFSGVLLGVLLVSALFFQFTRGSWLEYGVDFAGGTLIQVTFNEPATTAEVRDAIEQGLSGAQVSQFGGENAFVIRTPVMGEAASGTAFRVPELLEQRFGAGAFVVDRNEEVGAKVGGELQSKAAIAVLLSFAATLIYLAFRFEWRFGLAAVIATGHDVVLTIGVISALQFEVALPTVAAVLTIVGYSLNDTIIIFDRVRENLHGPGKRLPFVDVLNLSINATLPRTVLTGSTTLATLLALFLFGGTVVREFAVIMIIGITLGTYSSIFVAAPALRAIEKQWPRDTKKAKRPATAKAAL
ncbi:MAG: protein translocase subunit SecF [Longimicrobiales bacterium]